MKYFFLLFALSMISCNSQPNNCSNFKTGTFEYTDKHLKHFTIIRNDSVQVEYNNRDDITINTSIEWTSECTYVLTYEDVTNHPYKDKVIGEKIYVKILKIDGDKYVSQISSNTTESKIKMMKVKE